MCKYQLVVVIVNYKTPQLVIDSLNTLLPELTGLNVKAVVVDNASNDGSVQKIQSWINKHDPTKKVMIIASPHNKGFSSGNNLGIQAFKAEYYILLNSDTLVREGAISALLDAAKQDRTVGLVGPRLEWPDGQAQESCFRFHSPVSEFISSINTGPVAKLLRNYNVAYPVIAEQQYYDWVSFACVLIKAEVLEDIGLMDEGYFMYFEDVSFAYHAQQVGWKILNEPKAHVVHLRGGSSPVKSQTKKRKRLPRYYYESRTRLFYQIYGYSGLLLSNVLWMIGWALSNIRHFISTDYIPSGVESQWKDIWTNFFKPLRHYIEPSTYK